MPRLRITCGSARQAGLSPIGRNFHLDGRPTQRFRLRKHITSPDRGKRRASGSAAREGYLVWSPGASTVADGNLWAPGGTVNLVSVASAGEVANPTA